jgi:hypothetical protein
MAELIITLRPVRETGPLEIQVHLESDEDTLPHEHEDQHRLLVGRLLPSLGSGESQGTVVEVQRERPARQPAVG